MSVIYRNINLKQIILNCVLCLVTLTNSFEFICLFSHSVLFDFLSFFLLLNIMIPFRQYIFLALFIYLLTLVLSCLIYFLLIFLEKSNPLLTFYIYEFNDFILSAFEQYSRPLRFILPNRTNDEYYIILINFILSIFACIYAYLFCKYQ